MEMKELTPALLNELIERIEVYETEGTGKNRTQRIMIYYRFVGYIEISGGDRKRNQTANTRKGVAVQYLTTKPNSRHKAKKGNHYESKKTIRSNLNHI